MYHAYCAPRAYACICGGENGRKIKGILKLYPHCDGVLVTVQVRGLPETPDNFFGLHIHEGGGCGGVGFAESGSHYDPNDFPHPRHAGDLPPLLACKGRAYLAVVTDRFQIQEVIGKTVILHSAPDDFTTQPSGNAGSKIACGIIEQV